MVRGRKGEFVDLFKELTAKGYSRARVDGKLIQLSDPPKLGKQFKHTIEVVVDRLVVKEGISQRLTDSVETALGLAEGRVLAEFVDLEADDPERHQGLLREPRLPQRASAGHRRDRAAVLLVQQPVRRLLRLQRHRHPAGSR